MAGACFFLGRWDSVSENQPIKDFGSRGMMVISYKPHAPADSDEKKATQGGYWVNASIEIDPLKRSYTFEIWLTSANSDYTQFTNGEKHTVDASITLVGMTLGDKVSCSASKTNIPTKEFSGLDPGTRKMIKDDIEAKLSTPSATHYGASKEQQKQAEQDLANGNEKVYNLDEPFHIYPYGYDEEPSIGMTDGSVDTESCTVPNLTGISFSNNTSVLSVLPPKVVAINQDGKSVTTFLSVWYSVQRDPGWLLSESYPRFDTDASSFTYYEGPGDNPSASLFPRSDLTTLILRKRTSVDNGSEYILYISLLGGFAAAVGFDVIKQVVKLRQQKREEKTGKGEERTYIPSLSSARIEKGMR